MKLIRRVMICLAFALTMVISASLCGQDYAGRKELKRADLSGAPGMEVVLSVVEFRPGDRLPVHIHHGIETAYVLEGGMLQEPGKPPVAMPTGAPIMALRDVPHGGWAVVGDKAIKLMMVHIVDKGKPLYDWVNYNIQVPLPDFSVTVTLSDRARAKFQESKETIIVRAYFADKIGPEEELSLGDAELELRQPGTVSFKNVIFVKENVEALRNPDYEVLINVSSGRRSSDKNLLWCEPPLLKGPISTFQKKSFSVTCDLGKWVK